jgi:sec-independent protein translocase protein TatC
MDTPRPEDLHDPKMPLLEHLIEFRRRILYVLIALGVLFTASYAYHDEIMVAVQLPLTRLGIKAQYDTLTVPFMTHLKAAFYVSLFLTTPFAVAQLWLFIRPALYRRERSLVWPFLIFSYPLFVGGALFFYFVVFPVAIEFFTTFDPNLAPSLRIDDFFSFAITMLFIFGLVFELPLVALLLTRMGLLTPQFMAKNRGYAMVLIAIAAAVLTPTPDVINMLLMMAPLVVLYEVSIIICRFVKAKKKTDEPVA